MHDIIRNNFHEESFLRRDKHEFTKIQKCTLWHQKIDKTTGYYAIATEI